MGLQDTGPLQPNQCCPLHAKRWYFSLWASWKGLSTLFKGRSWCPCPALAWIHPFCQLVFSERRWHPDSWLLSHPLALVRFVGVIQVGRPMWWEVHPGAAILASGWVLSVKTLLLKIEVGTRRKR